LGRPIRDQVYSTRDNQATTLQALELTNGETLTHWLLRGAQAMLQQVSPAPVTVFDASYNGRAPVPIDIDVSKMSKLWLLVEDNGSYSPDKLETVWGKAGFDGPNGRTDLADLKPVDGSGMREDKTDGVPVKTPSRLVYDISGKGFTRFYALAGVDNKLITSDLNPRLRFMVFDREPDTERLTPVTPGSPVPGPPELKTSKDVVERVFRYALGRAPSAKELDVSESALFDKAHPNQVSVEGLADLLWAVMMKPEFQLIY
jgi:hypothetical protein